MKLNTEDLKIAMARKQLNGPELAKNMNVSYASISYFLSGKRQPSTKMLGVLAEALEVDVTELIED